MSSCEVPNSMNSIEDFPLTYEPKTVRLGDYQQLYWRCECGLLHILTAGSYVLTCLCEQQAGFIIDNVLQK